MSLDVTWRRWQHNIIRIAVDTNLGGTDKTLKDRDAIQWDQSRLEEWASSVKFSEELLDSLEEHNYPYDWNENHNETPPVYVSELPKTCHPFLTA